ncbi:hypothetical protein V6N11_050365 [Hibiscus sabdariffa]|uniref:Uncharacterized protein n=1 Tax=Hibiscus sabdariffa TaxID=183260 RepID=A0ABR2TA88_9ROSI
MKIVEMNSSGSLRQITWVDKNGASASIEFGWVWKLVLDLMKQGSGNGQVRICPFTAAATSLEWDEFQQGRYGV